MAVYIAAVFALIGADQVVKILVQRSSIDIPLIGDFLAFRYCENTGAAFGSFQGHREVLICVTGVLVVGCIFFLFSKKQRSPLVKFALSLIIAGGMSNLYDRIFRGSVVDFIAVKYFATFNIADSCVVIGAALLLLHVLLDESRRKKKENGA